MGIMKGSWLRTYSSIWLTSSSNLPFVLSIETPGITSSLPSAYSSFIEVGTYIDLDSYLKSLPWVNLLTQYFVSLLRHVLYYTANLDSINLLLELFGASIKSPTKVKRPTTSKTLDTIKKCFFHFSILTFCLVSTGAIFLNWWFYDFSRLRFALI